MKYSVIDISSSSLSLIVANADEKKAEIIFKDRVSLYLFPHLEGKSLSRRGIDKLTEALSLMKEKCASLGVERCYVISTAALRFIENYGEVSRAVTDRTGLAVNFIDGATEAYCDYVANSYYAGYERPVLIDQGGKSLEICDLLKKSKEDMLCFDFGLIDLHRKFVKKYQPDEEEAKDIKKYVKNRFDRADLPGKEVYSTAVLVGPTNCALYDIYSEFTGDSAADGVKTVDYKKFKKLVKHLLSGDDRSGLIMNNAPEKLAVIGPAAVVLKVLFKRFGVSSIIVSDKGVKEGYLQLVLEGGESGAYYDFASGAVFGEVKAEPQPEENESNPRKKGKKEQSGEKKEKKSAGKAADGTKEKPEKKKGAKAEKEKEVSAASDNEKAGAAGAAPARRGRPPKAAAPAARRDRRPAAKGGANNSAAAEKTEKQAPAAESPAPGAEIAQEKSADKGIVARQSAVPALKADTAPAAQNTEISANEVSPAAEKKVSRANKEPFK